MSPAIEELKEAIIHACGGMTREEVKYVVNKYLEKELYKLRKNVTSGCGKPQYLEKLWIQLRKLQKPRESQRKI